MVKFSKLTIRYISFSRIIISLSKDLTFLFTHYNTPRYIFSHFFCSISLSFSFFLNFLMSLIFFPLILSRKINRRQLEPRKKAQKEVTTLPIISLSWSSVPTSLCHRVLSTKQILYWKCVQKEEGRLHASY